MGVNYSFCSCAWGGSVFCEREGGLKKLYSSTLAVLLKSTISLIWLYQPMDFLMSEAFTRSSSYSGSTNLNNRILSCCLERLKHLKVYPAAYYFIMKQI